MPEIAVTALSHDGLMRDHNEDSLVVGSWTLCAATTTPTPTPQTLNFPIGEPVVAAVADGLGGHPAGEYASSFAVRYLAWAGPRLTDEAAVRAALVDCNLDVYAEAERHRERVGMGTTIAGVVVTGADVIVFNVGDSRVYRVESTGLMLLSTDDSESPGIFGRRSPVLTQCLGGSLTAESIKPHVHTHPLAARTRYLICSDGLTDAVDDDDAIAAVLRDHEGAKAAVTLWRAAMEAGAPDNVTLALVEISAS